MRLAAVQGAREILQECRSTTPARDRAWRTRGTYCSVRTRTIRPGDSHNSAARRATRSSTGCGSPGEADIAWSTSIVAACCSIALAILAVAFRASAAVRSCNSRYVSALVIAITACSAKVCSRAIWLSENGPVAGRPMVIAPSGTPSRNIGTAITDQWPSTIHKTMPRIGGDVFDLVNPSVQDCAAHRGVQPHWPGKL